MHTTAASLQGFYEASASVAGALIGLLFVAVSVAHDRGGGPDGTQHQVPAGAALSAFTNTLVISLFGLIYGGRIALPAAFSGLAGLSFVLGSLLAILRKRANGQSLLVLVVLGGIFITQAVVGFSSTADSGSINTQQTMATLSVACALSGIARSWELIGARRLRLFSEVRAFAQDLQHAPEPGSVPRSD